MEMMIGNILKRFEEMNQFLNTEESNDIPEIETTREVMKTSYGIVRQEYDKYKVRNENATPGTLLTLIEQLLVQRGERDLTEMLASMYLGVDTGKQTDGMVTVEFENPNLKQTGK